MLVLLISLFRSQHQLGKEMLKSKFPNNGYIQKIFPKVKYFSKINNAWKSIIIRGWSSNKTSQLYTSVLMPRCLLAVDAC